MRIDYQGNLHTIVTGQLPTQVIHTDGLKRYGGTGECFSPGDLLAASIGSCIATIIGIDAKTRGWDLKGMYLDVEKEKKEGSLLPIGSFTVKISIPFPLSEEQKNTIIKEAETSPMCRCLNNSIELKIIVHSI